MVNEYRESLERYEEMQRRYQEFRDAFAEGQTPPEEEMIVFALDLDKYWPLMFALEQRQTFRELKRKVLLDINCVYRNPNKRHGAWGSGGAYVGILGEVKERKGLGDLLDEIVHQGKPVLTLAKVIGMAEAVDKLNNKVRRDHSK